MKNLLFLFCIFLLGCESPLRVYGQENKTFADYAVKVTPVTFSVLLVKDIQEENCPQGVQVQHLAYFEACSQKNYMLTIEQKKNEVLERLKWQIPFCKSGTHDGARMIIC